MRKALIIDYTNHRGERRKRRIEPFRIFFGSSEYHSGENWILRAWDLERGEPTSETMRDFLVTSIHSMEREP